jgi:hypothetical protein
MANEWMSKLRGTMLSLFTLGGTAGVLFKNSSGTLNIKTADDSAHADMTAKSAKIHGTNASNGVILGVPAALGGNVTLTLPPDAGSAGQFLSTDGSGVLTFEDGLSGADLSVRVPFDESSGTLALLSSIPANSILRKIVVEVEVAAAAGSPTLSIGIAGDTDLYGEVTDFDMKTVALYMINLEEELGATPDNIIATIVASSQTFSGDIVLTYALP